MSQRLLSPEREEALDMKKRKVNWEGVSLGTEPEIIRQPTKGTRAEKGKRSEDRDCGVSHGSENRG